MKAPDFPTRNDLWITEDDYTLYAFDGDVWVAVTESDPYYTPQVDFSFERFSASVSSDFDVVDNRSAPTVQETDLSQYDTLLIYAAGSVKRMKALTNSGTANWVYDSTTKKINLTDRGRNKIYKFSFFNPERTAESPRINYELFLYKDNGRGSEDYKNGVRGYAVTVPSKITNTIKKTKAFFSKLPDSTYSADADLGNNTSSDITNLGRGTTFSGRVGENFISSDNFVTDASEELVAGDVVVFTNDSGMIEYKLVYFVTKPFGYGENRTKCTIYFTTTLQGTVTGKSASRVRIKSFGNRSESLIYQLPKSVIATLETNPDDTGIEYQIFRQFITTIKQGENSVELKADINQSFVSNPT